MKFSASDAMLVVTFDQFGLHELKAAVAARFGR
jgi:hypothetical protein